jgi:hypothetical protein
MPLPSVSIKYSFATDPQVSRKLASPEMRAKSKNHGSETRMGFPRLPFRNRGKTKARPCPQPRRKWRRSKARCETALSRPNSAPSPRCAYRSASETRSLRRRSLISNHSKCRDPLNPIRQSTDLRSAREDCLCVDSSYSPKLHTTEFWILASLLET